MAKTFHGVASIHDPVGTEYVFLDAVIEQLKFWVDTVHDPEFADDEFIVAVAEKLKAGV